MKNITAIILVVLCLFQSSCNENFLDQTDPTKVGVDLFYENEAQVKQALNGVYGSLQTITNQAYLFGEFQTDNTTVDLNPSDRGGAGGWKLLNFLQSTLAMVRSIRFGITTIPLCTILI